MKRFKKILSACKYKSLRWLNVSAFRIRSWLIGFGRKRISLTFSIQKEWAPTILRNIDHRRYAVRFLAFRNLKSSPPHVLIPLTVEDVLFLSSKEDSKRTEHHYLTPPKNAIEICDDKWVFCNWMIQHGFEKFVPPIADFDASIEYPYILKKRVDAFGKNAHIIRNLSDLKTIEVKRPAEYYKQAYIINDSEYTCHILFKDKKIVFSKTLCFRYDTQYYVKGVQSTYSTCTESPPSPYLDTFAEVLAALDFSGVCCFNYKLVGNKFYIFEINPRVGASLLPYINELVEQYLTREKSETRP